jgi:hypothetical protein
VQTVIARALAAASVCLLMQCAAASAYPDLDWKLYRWTDIAGKGDVCFYEERSLTRAHTGFVRVWAKCLAQSDLDAAGPDKRNAPYTRAVIDMSASRRRYGYSPPILAVETLGRKEVSAAILYEAVADFGGLAPKDMTFYEIDCRAHRARVLGDMTNDKSVPPSGWKDIPSKGTAARLRQQLCR